jgi:hypothetical protein
MSRYQFPIFWCGGTSTYGHRVFGSGCQFARSPSSSEGRKGFSQQQKGDNDMRVLRIVGFLFVLLLSVVTTGGCGSRNTPEGVVRGYLEAINAGDAAKASSYISPDIRNSYYLDPARQIAEGTKYNVRGISTADSGGGTKTVTVIGTASWPSGSREGRWGYRVEKINGRWYLMDFLGTF